MKKTRLRTFVYLIITKILRGKLFHICGTAVYACSYFLFISNLLYCVWFCVRILRSEFVEEAIPASTDSNVGASATQVKVLKRGLLGNLVHCSSVSNDHLEDKVVSVAQCSSFVAHGADSVPTPSSSKCKLSASDDKSYIEKTSSCSNAQSHLEKAKLAGKSINSVGVLSSFEAIIRSLTRTKESIGRATRIAIDCAKFGFASKVDLPGNTVISVVPNSYKEDIV